MQSSAWSRSRRPGAKAIATAAADPLGSGVLGGLAIGAIEVAGVGAARPGVVAVVLGLLAMLGLAAGAATAGTAWLIARRGWRGWAAAFAHALPAAVPLALVARTLFDGSFAATLPGARHGGLLVPLCGTVALAAAVRIGGGWLDGSRTRRRAAVAALVVAVAAIEWGNRSVLRAEYPDLHAFLALVTVVLAGLAIRTAAARRGMSVPEATARPAPSLAAALAPPSAGLSQPQRLAPALPAAPLLLGNLPPIPRPPRPPGPPPIPPPLPPMLRRMPIPPPLPTPVPELRRRPSAAMGATAAAAPRLPALGPAAVARFSALAPPAATRLSGLGAALSWRGRLAVAAPVLSLFGWALPFGLDAPADRWVLATAGSHGRQLTRVARAAIDLDGDGASAVLGGADCDDLDARRSPGAREVPGNGIDEDCDGADAPAVVPSPSDRARMATLATWQAGPEATRLRAAAAGWDVVVVSVDALRADMLAAEAPRRREFPALAALLDDAVWFERGIAPAAGTDVSLGSFTTGRTNPFQPIEATLAEAMQRSGRVTGAVLPREVLRYAGETLLSRGFDRVERVVSDGETRDVGDHVTAGETTRRALAFVDRAAAGDRPYFLWAHYFDVHEHLQLAVDEATLAPIAADGISPGERAYRALVAVTDAAIGDLIAGLRQRGRLDRTVIVFFSDHGESLGEDRRLPDNHGLYVYHALTHVPIAVRLPDKVGARRRDPTPVTLADLTATLVALVGQPAPAEPAGVDLLPLLVAAPPVSGLGDRLLVINESEQWGVVAWPWKLLVRPSDNLVELYQLERDPGERVDLAHAEPERVRTLRQGYAGFPKVPLDRSRAGRSWRERQAQPPRRR